MIPLIFALTLTWLDNSQYEDGFYILRKVQSDKTFQIVATLPPNTRRYVDTDLKKNKTYCYYVVAYKGQEREYSNADCQKNTH